MLSSFLMFVIVLSILVLIHEIGHFMTARWFKMKVNEFGLGLPPKIFSIKKKGVIWSLNWIPFGGFVSIKGEERPL